MLEEVLRCLVVMVVRLPRGDVLGGQHRPDRAVRTVRAPDGRQGPHGDKPLWLGTGRRHPATTVDKPVTGHFGHRSHEPDPRPGRHCATVPSISAQRHDSITAGRLRPNRRSTRPGRADNELTLRPLVTGIDGQPGGHGGRVCGRGPGPHCTDAVVEVLGGRMRHGRARRHGPRTACAQRAVVQYPVLALRRRRTADRSPVERGPASRTRGPGLHVRRRRRRLRRRGGPRCDQDRPGGPRLRLRTHPRRRTSRVSRSASRATALRIVIGWLIGEVRELIGKACRTEVPSGCSSAGPRRLTRCHREITQATDHLVPLYG